MRGYARLAVRLGLYRPLRSLQLHTVSRGKLATLRENTTFFAQFFEPGDLVFDVGANRGDMSDALLRGGARVVAFEPQSEMVDFIEARCGPNPNLTVLECGVGAEEGTATLFVNDGHTGASSLLEDWGDDAPAASRTVPIVTLGEMVERYGKPRYVKIDVEGFEGAVLEGLREAVPYLSFEQSRDREGGIEAALDCMARLRQFGELEFNVTPAELNRFVYDEWKPGDAFADTYPTQLAGFEHRYGDVFVRFPALV